MDYPNPLSLSSRTPTQIQFGSSFPTNWLESQNLENPFYKEKTLNNYSATPYRLPTYLTKHTNPLQIILPASKYAKINEPETADEALVQSRILLVKARVAHNQRNRNQTIDFDYYKITISDYD